MTDHIHWWLAAVSFTLGLVLTFTLMARPTKTQMPAWVLAEPAPRAKPEPPVMKVPAAEAPTEEIPIARPRPAKKKSVSKAPATKRRPVPRDAVTERIPVARKRVAKKVPGQKVPGQRVPGKRAPAKKVRPKDAVTEKIPVVEAVTEKIPLIPYAPYGPGSMRAAPDGSGPEGWPVKGRTDSRLFYSPDDADYDDVEAQVWFENEDFAARAFFTPGRNSARKE